MAISGNASLLKDLEQTQKETTTKQVTTTHMTSPETTVERRSSSIGSFTVADIKKIYPTHDEKYIHAVFGMCFCNQNPQYVRLWIMALCAICIIDIVLISILMAIYSLVLKKEEPVKAQDAAHSKPNIPPATDTKIPTVATP
ncbi:uncharacterized protein O3C94_016353 [Discoglossus pictus]